MLRSRLSRSVSVLGVIVLLATACGDSGDDEGAPVTSGGPSASAASSTTLAPQRGGVATVGSYSRDTGLDPAKLAGGGTVGANELAAIYDVIMRYNDATGKYEPRTAESLTPSMAALT